MKLINTVCSLLIVISLFSVIACSDDDSPTIADQQLSLLVGTWFAPDDGSVTLEGVPANGDWSNFSITFNSDKTVSVSNVPPEAEIFDIQSFFIDGSRTTDFILIFNASDEETANVEIAGDQMTMTFELDTNEDVLGARTSGVGGGTYVFDLVKE